MKPDQIVKVLDAFDKHRNSANRIAKIAKELHMTKGMVNQIISNWSIYETADHLISTNTSTKDSI